MIIIINNQSIYSYNYIQQFLINQFEYSNINMDEGIDNLIDFLNSGSNYQPLSQQKKTKKNKPSTSSASNQPPSKSQQQEQLDDFMNFQAVYEARLEKMEKKNEQREQKEKKKQELQEAAKKKYATKQIVISDTVKLPTIRYLIFKNWSGSHLDYEVKDNGYKFRFTNGVVGLVKHMLQENGFFQSSDNDGTFIWNIGVVNPSVYQTMGSYMKINHFPKTYEITRKDLMLQNLSKMKNKHSTHYNFFPRTYILPAQSSTFTEDAQKQKSLKWYIVKPHNKSQGRGIWISNKVQEILKKQKQCIVVSEYINNPLLVNKLKFDLRIYVAITSINPLRIYMYDDGLARFATNPYSYDLSSKEDLYAHLTNYSLNKYSENFVPNDDPQDNCVGHKWSLPALKDFLRSEGLDVELIWTRIEDIVIKTIISIQNTVFSAFQMSVPYRDNCFEVLGFDILIDDNLRPWLVEINLSPSLNTDSPLDLKIKGNMLSDLFSMIGIVSLDQRYSTDKSYLLNSNKLFTHKQSGTEWVKLQRLVVKQSEEQAKRSGGWRKIFPTETAIRYKQFFDVDRPLNRLLRDQQLNKVRNQKGVNYNQALRTINQNPQKDQPPKKK